MKTTRHLVFETNSSSTHSVSFASGGLRNQRLLRGYIKLGEFGWEVDHDRDEPDDKASYVLTYLYQTGQEDYAEEVMRWISEYMGMEIGLEVPKWYGIDHQSLDTLTDEVFLSCKDSVLDFIFCSSNSFSTDNDNY